MDSRNIDHWVASADNENERTFREAVHTILYAIASSTNLQPQMIMKGGILMAIRYETGRFTTDKLEPHSREAKWSSTVLLSPQS